MRLNLAFIFLFILAAAPPAARAQEGEVLNNESIRKMKERRKAPLKTRKAWAAAKPSPEAIRKSESGRGRWAPPALLLGDCPSQFPGF